MTWGLKTKPRAIPAAQETRLQALVAHSASLPPSWRYGAQVVHVRSLLAHESPGVRKLGVSCLVRMEACL